MTIEEEVAITLARLRALDEPKPDHSFTWGEWCRLHPLSEYRDREWRRWEAELDQPWNVGSLKVRNPVPSMKALKAGPLCRKARWEGPWRARQGEEWRKAIGEPPREEEAVLQGQADRSSRELMLNRCFDINWVQANL